MLKGKKRIALIFAVIVLLILILTNFNVTDYTHTSNVYFLPENYPFTQNDENKLNALNVNKLMFSISSEKLIDTNDSTVSDTLKYKAKVNTKYCIDELKFSFTRFIPFYKPVSFSATIIYEWEAMVESNIGEYKVIDQSRLRINGDYRMSGVISEKKIKSIINKGMRNSIETAMRKEVDDKVFEQIKNYN